MATTPWFVFSPSTVLSAVGLLHGPDRIEPTPAEDWRDAVIDVVIPALNEERHIIPCLHSIARQTIQPRKIILVDDGSHDRTSEFARLFANSLGMTLQIVRRPASIGKTPSIKFQAREDDADIEVVLDADTLFASDNYIERVASELYQGAGIASACGVVLPMREKDIRARLAEPLVSNFLATHPEIQVGGVGSSWHRLMRGITNLYREVLYTFLQRFVYNGQMVFFGSIVNPVGCAVAYRRKYLRDLFDQFEPKLGDNLSNSEDIFIGFAFLEQGYRNIQLMDIQALSVEPQADHLPSQIYLWSSAFLQSCYYFDELVRGPLKAVRRYFLHHEPGSETAEPGRDRRRIREAYRQRFGVEHTYKYGRPMAWVLLLSLAEKIFFPTTLIIMLVIGAWQALGITLIAETAITAGILATVSSGHRLEMLGKGILTTPIRYASLLFDSVTITRFAVDLWVTHKRDWRK